MAITYEDVSRLRQTELNWAQVHNFYCVIERLPDLVFTCQRVQLGSLTAGETMMSNRYNMNRMLPGESLDYGVANIDFIVTQNFSNYRSILEWMKANQRSESFQQGIDYLQNLDRTTGSEPEFKDTMSSMTVIGTDAADRPMCQWNFKNVFPISLESPSFDATITDVQYITSGVTFQYHYFEHQTYLNGALQDNKI